MNKFNLFMKIIAVFLIFLFPIISKAANFEDRLVRSDHKNSIIKPLEVIKIVGKSRANNLMTFSNPVKSIYIPPGFNLPKPFSVNDDKTLIFSPDNDVEETPITINLVNGENLNFVLRFEKSENPFYYEQARSSDVPRSKKPVSKRVSEKYIADAFIDVFEGRIPKGFVVENSQQHFEIDIAAKSGQDVRLTMYNNASYKSDTYHIKKWTISSESLVSVTNEDFFEDGDIAIFIDKDYVSPESPLTLIKLEKINNER